MAVCAAHEPGPADPDETDDEFIRPNGYCSDAELELFFKLNEEPSPAGSPASSPTPAGGTLHGHEERLPSRSPWPPPYAS